MRPRISNIYFELTPMNIPRIYWNLSQIEELQIFSKEIQRHMFRQFYWTWPYKKPWRIGALIAAAGMIALGVWLASLEPKTWLSVIFHLGGFLAGALTIKHQLHQCVRSSFEKAKDRG